MRNLCRFLIIALTIALPAVAAADESAYDLDAPRVQVRYSVLCVAIQVARTKLADQPLPDDFRTGEAATGRDALVAVWQPDADLDDIRVIEVADGKSRTPGFEVAVVPSNGLWQPGRDGYNGVNTTYHVTSPAGWHVLAIKVNTKRAGVAIYQPYDVAYHTTENMRNGLQYLKDVMTAARERLDTLGVKSRWRPGMSLTAALDDRMLAALILDEHMDKDEVEVRGVEWSVQKSLVLYALNRERNYWYAISPKAAAGIAQFINGTYQTTRGQYPEAGLPEDLLAAMRDHATAVMAMHCHVDHLFAELRDAHVRQPATPQLRGAFLAAAYNSGFGVPQCSAACLKSKKCRPKCFKGAIPAYRNHVYFCHQAKYRRAWCHKDHGLPRETVTYVRKFAGVYDLPALKATFAPPPQPTVATPHKTRPHQTRPRKR